MKILYLGNRNKHETACHPQFSHTTAQALPYLSSTAQTQPQNAVRPPNFAFICHKTKQNHNHGIRNRNPSHPLTDFFASFQGYKHIVYFLSKSTDFEFFWNPPKIFSKDSEQGVQSLPPPPPDGQKISLADRKGIPSPISAGIP